MEDVFVKNRDAEFLDLIPFTGVGTGLAKSICSGFTEPSKCQCYCTGAAVYMCRSPFLLVCCVFMRKLQ